MRKILLVMESYSDLIQLESLLRRLGFDVAGMQSPVSLSERLLSFSPDVVVMNGKGTKVNGVEVSQKIKKRKGLPKIILTFPKNHTPSNQDMRANMDLMMEWPMDPNKFLMQLCNLVGLDSKGVMEKFAKTQAKEEASDPLINAGHEGAEKPELIRVSDRTKKYDEILKSVQLPHKDGLDRQAVQAAVKANKKHVAPDEDSDEARQAFVRALFRKK